MKSIEDIQQELVDEFALFPDWQEKYSHIIELGRELPGLDPAHKTEANKVKGCQSQVWLNAEAGADGRLHLQAESDALIVQGLIAILLRIYDGQPAECILAADLSCFKRIGLLSHLSMNRTNGLNSMVQRIRAHAGAVLTGPAEG